MTKLMLGTVFGSTATIVCLVLFGGLLYSPAQNRLVDTWRKVKPGMSRAEIVEWCGVPSHDFPILREAPAWARETVSEHYGNEWKLLVFTIQGPGPQLLLVFLDQQDRVSFVASVPA